MHAFDIDIMASNTGRAYSERIQQSSHVYRPTHTHITIYICK